MSKEISREEAEKHATPEFWLLRHMIDTGMKLNRETYIHTAWMDEPEEWTAEHEQQVPECFRDHSSLPAMKKNYDVPD
jgi:hypothetical protein